MSGNLDQQKTTATARRGEGEEASPVATSSKPVVVILGIDPGVSGGMAFFSPSNPRHIAAEDIPVVAGEVDIDTMARRIRQMAPTFAIIERVHSMPKQGVASSFKFGMAYGAARALVTGLGIPSRLVTPQAWKKHFRLSSDGELSRSLALQLWPDVGCFSRKKDHNRAEAALLARYGAEVVLRDLDPRGTDPPI